MRWSHELSTWWSALVPTCEATAAPGIPATTESTRATNPSWEANGSAAQILSSTVQPSEPSAFKTPESTAGTGGPNCTCSSGDHPFGPAPNTIGITSEADPPPDTVGAFVTESGAVFAVRTVTLI